MLLLKVMEKYEFGYLLYLLRWFTEYLNSPHPGFNFSNSMYDMNEITGTAWRFRLSAGLGGSHRSLLSAGVRKN